MIKTIGTLRWVFLGLFVLLNAGVWTWQIGWVQPRKQCEASGRWWSGVDRVCATPVSVSVFTGKPTPLEQEAAKARALP
jgi:hypothetical protein